MISASAHVIANDRRSRKLLLHRAEIALAKGKHDKQRLLRRHN